MPSFSWRCKSRQGHDFARNVHRIGEPRPPMITALIDRLDKRPREGFAAFALAHAALWTLLPATLYPNLPLDLIEALTYGREWQRGYDKLPPLPWWLIEIAYQAFAVDWVYYLIAQATVLAAFALVWLLARRPARSSRC